MTQPELLFVMKLNKARHDKAFQFFLARSFGERLLARDATMALIVRRWRGITYVVGQMVGLDPVPQGYIKPYPLDL